MREITGPDWVHLLEHEAEWAIKSALAANRPLLVRGEPGVGKTQLARAAAKDLERPLVTLTVDAHTESRDLMWSFDAVERLAEAQVASVTTCDASELQTRIAVSKFVRPGPIWWAIDWRSAAAQLRPNEKPPAKPPGNWNSSDGAVILIDEIDKAESDVPNGLLEAFGTREFTPMGFHQPVALADDAAPPLMIVTTNEERVLPDAFVRRCFVLNLELPKIASTPPASEEESKRDQAFVDFLAQRGKAHFPNASAELLVDAAALLLKDRRHAMSKHLTPLPGQAEYLDFLRAITKLTDAGEDEATVFENIQSFVFQKSSEVPG